MAALKALKRAATWAAMRVLKAAAWRARWLAVLKAEPKVSELVDQMVV